jgi:sigma-B regulation protein RsbU (phosphoserine phosphatase)
MILFALGTLIGVILMWLLYSGNSRRLKLAQEEKQLLEQEKHIVVEFMHNMVEAVIEEGSRTSMFQRIIHAAVLSTGAMSACIFEKQTDNSLKGVAVEGLFPPQRKVNTEIGHKAGTRAQHIEAILRSESFTMGEGLIGSVGQSRRGLLIADAAHDPRVIQHEDPALKIRSMIVVPVVFRGDLVAVLALANPCDGLAFNQTDFSLVESLAEQVGLAVHNSDAMKVQIEKSKLDLDLELASNIQNLLLPSRFPETPNLEFAAHYTAAQKIGGDLYDVFPLQDNKIGVAIADVSGKGIAASIIMAICQTNLHHLSRSKNSPAEILKAINAEMHESMRRDMFITMIYAVIDVANESITLARAGHELPLHYHRDTAGQITVDKIQSTGMAIGMVPPEIFDSTIVDTTLHFSTDDAFLLYTDGVTESVNLEGEEFSGERLIDTLQTSGRGSAQAILNTVITSVERFSGEAGQTDDLTLIAVKHR